ncbi:MAG TPA: hypothetical protein VFP17_03155 [Solirubrobacterales bacterium]|nr:hypothetical protein [Solirubrobacterales bacterium]
MQALTESDFFQGLVASLAIRGVKKISIRTDNFDPVLLAVFERLEERAQELEIEPDFDIIPDPIHGDSQTVRDILASAAADGLISFDNPEYQDIEIKIGPHSGETLLSRDLAPLRGLFTELADVFLENYERTPLT